MKIKQLRMENFKTFKKAEIDFRPLTLLTGVNSSGKSTILNAINSILQTEVLKEYPFHFVPNGSYCSLGSFRDIVYKHNTKQTFSIGLTIEQEAIQVHINASYRYSSSGNKTLLNSLEFDDSEDNLKIRWNGQDVGYEAFIDARSFSKTMGSDFGNTLTNFVASLRGDTEDKAATKIRNKILEDLSQSSVGATKLKARESFDIVSELKRHLAGSYLYGSLSAILGDLRKESGYSGPVRAYPSRLYPEGYSSYPLDPEGKNAISLLFEWQKYSPNKFKEVCESIKLIELASELREDSESGEMHKLLVQPFKHKESVNLVDAGFGVSQALPIVIADVALPKNSTLLINQPEVHLHPSSQAKLGNYFVSRLKARNYVMETHSEYLINRLRILVAQGVLSTDDAIIIFIDDTGGKTGSPKIHYIEIKTDGSLVNAPKRFFETYFLDTFKLATEVFTKEKSK
jgi:predicted ATPase